MVFCLLQSGWGVLQGQLIGCVECYALAIDQGVFEESAPRLSLQVWSRNERLRLARQITFADASCHIVAGRWGTNGAYSAQCS